jgi:dolichyl-phosphate-mannose--protein O-mannosyl transferase
MYALRALSHGGLILLIVIPAYLATFIPFFTQGRNCTFKQMIANHNTMIQFRYKKEFDHKYISRFYTWPLVIRPMWYLFDEEPLGKTPKAEVFDDEQGTGGLGERFRQFVKPYLVEEAGKAVYGIVAMGSPIFWWTFILFFIEISVKGFARRDPRLLFLFTGYLPQWLLWAGATRGGFIYYMLPCIPFMAVIAAHVLEEWRDTKAGRVMIVGYLVSILLFLLIFFPFLTAYPATIDYFDRLFRFSTWR